MTAPIEPTAELVAEWDAAIAAHLSAEQETAAVVEVAEEPSANAPIIASAVCTNPVCTHKGSFVAIHADTVLPVHCGGCSQVLHCDHQLETTTTQAGTLGAPQLDTVTACVLCRTETARETVTLPPVPYDKVPYAVLDLPLGS